MKEYYQHIYYDYYDRKVGGGGDLKQVTKLYVVMWSEKTWVNFTEPML
jgi:hypothetical protein